MDAPTPQASPRRWIQAKLWATTDVTEVIPVLRDISACMVSNNVRLGWKAARIQQKREQTVPQPPPIQPPRPSACTTGKSACADPTE